jgi:hypothetical protein
LKTVIHAGAEGCAYWVPTQTTLNALRLCAYCISHIQGVVRRTDMRAERTDKVFLVAKVGQTIISAALTDAPWRLPGDALVVPADADGSLQGSLARALRQAVGVEWEPI